MKKPFLTYEKLLEIINKYPTPFHLYDEKGIIDNIRALKKAFSWNKDFKEYFAIKATPNPFILEIFKKEGCGVDCATLAELKMAKAVGFLENEIMFSSNNTPDGEFEFANSLGGIINLDDITLIDQMVSELNEVPDTICCRYNPGGLYEMSNGIMDNPGDSKYGMTKEQLFASYEKLKNLGVKNFGIHAFLASNTLTCEYYPKLARDLFKIVVEIKEKLGITLNFVNLSGGIGVNYLPDEEPNDILLIGDMVKSAYDDILVSNKIKDLAIYTELGRFMTGPFGHLITKVIHKKHIYKEYIGVDACAANLMRPAMYGAYHHITLANEENLKRPLCKYDIVGGLCENNDKFAVDRMMMELKIGDILIIHDTGAHGFSMGYNYNGKLRSSEILLKKDGSFSLIRRAETLKDYFATFDIFDFDFDT